MKKVLFGILFVLITSSYCITDLTIQEKILCNKLIPFWEKFVSMPESKYTLLYHIMCLFDPSYSASTEESIRKNGLFSSNQLIKNGIRSRRKEIVTSNIAEDYKDFLPNEFNSVYFIPQYFFYERNTSKFFAPSRIVRYLVRKNNHDVYNGLVRDQPDAKNMYQKSKIPLTEYIKSNSEEYFPEVIIKDKISASELIFYYPITKDDFRLINQGEQEDEESRKYYKID